MKNITNYINESTIPSKILDVIKSGISKGYVECDGVKYGISADNIFAIPLDDITLEEFKHAIEKLMNDGFKFKYQTSDEWKKAGYADPLED